MTSIANEEFSQEPQGPLPFALDSDDGEAAIQADETFARRIDTLLAGQLRTLVHDPDTGLASRPPEEALAAVPEAMTELERLGDAHFGQADTQRRRDFAAPMIRSRIERAQQELGAIEERATAALDDRTVEERLASLRQDAAVAWNDPAWLRRLGRSVVDERRHQGERNGWDRGQTETLVRQGASDLYAGAVERAIGDDLDGADKLFARARDVILPERKAALEQKFARAREAAGLAGIATRLAAAPDDPARRPDRAEYQARAADLTPPDASPEVRAKIEQMATIQQARADRAWQAARGRAAAGALDWLGRNPDTPLATMPAELRDGLSPEQQQSVASAAATGRVQTDPEIYEQLDRQAVYDPEAFAGVDLGQYRLSLGDKDYARFVAFQKGDATSQRYERGRTQLDQGLAEANVDPDGPEARAARSDLDKTLRSFETIEGRAPAMGDIERVAGDIRARLGGPYSAVPYGPGGPFTAVDGDQAPQLLPPEGRGTSVNTEPPSNDPEFTKALESWKGRKVILPDGSKIPDPSSPTGYLMAPFDQLGSVAAAGRETGLKVRLRLTDRRFDASAFETLYRDMKASLDHGGAFDYQRRTNENGQRGRFTQLPQFRNVSNVNVGLFAQQAGLPMSLTLAISGGFAFLYSKNWNPNDVFFLDGDTRKFIELGYKLGQSGMFDP